MTTPAHVDYIELFAASTPASKAFYQTAFGWAFTDYGPDYVGFHDGTREAGGFYSDGPPRPPLPVLLTDDLDAVRAQVIAAGASITAEHIFPGGRRFHFIDPAGNELAVWTKSDQPAQG